MSKSLGQIAYDAQPDVPAPANRARLDYSLLDPFVRAEYERMGAAVRDAVLAENKAEVDSVKHAATSWAEAANKWAAEYDRVFDELQLLKAEVASLAGEGKP